MSGAGDTEQATAQASAHSAPSRSFLTGFIDFFALVGRIFLFLLHLLYALVRPPWFFREVLLQTANVGRRCFIPVVCVLGPFGMVVALHGSEIFKVFGANRLLGFLVGLTTFRELAPNLVAILLAAQAGSSAAAELATMRTQEELEATEVMGVDPLKLHVLPRLLGILLAAPLLTVIGSSAGIIGGYLLAVVIQDQDGGAFLANLFAYLGLFDVANAALKALVFAFIVGLLACYLGYHSEGGARGVGRAVNNTVVYSIALFLLVNYFLSTALFGIME